MLLPRALSFRHIDVCADNLDRLSMRGEQMMAGCFEMMFDCSILNSPA
jgi:hypothetical protein